MTGVSHRPRHAITNSDSILGHGLFRKVFLVFNFPSNQSHTHSKLIFTLFKSLTIVSCFNHLRHNIYSFKGYSQSFQHQLLCNHIIFNILRTWVSVKHIYISISLLFNTYVISVYLSLIVSINQWLVFDRVSMLTLLKRQQRACKRHSASFRLIQSYTVSAQSVSALTTTQWFSTLYVSRGNYHAMTIRQNKRKANRTRMASDIIIGWLSCPQPHMSM